MAENRNTYTLRDEEIGTVRIADELITVIAALAATEVDGVSSMDGNLTNELIRKMGIKNLKQGVHTFVDDDGKVRFELSLQVDYGRSIAEVGREVQERVKSAVETMTGMEVTEVKIHVANVDLQAMEQA